MEKTPYIIEDLHNNIKFKFSFTSNFLKLYRNPSRGPLLEPSQWISTRILIVALHLKLLCKLVFDMHCLLSI